MALPPTAIHSEMEKILSFIPDKKTVEEIQLKLGELEIAFEKNKSKSHYIDLLNNYQRQRLAELALALKEAVSKISSTII